MRRGPMRCQRGQTTAEYVGLLVVVAAIIAALASADIHGRIVAAVGQAVCMSYSDDPQDNCGPEADERFAQAARGDEQAQDTPTDSTGPAQQSPEAAQGAPNLDAAEVQAAAERSLMVPSLPSPGGSPPPPAPEDDEEGGGFGDFLAGAGNSAWDAGGDIVDAGEGVVRHVDPFHPNATLDQWGQTAGAVRGVFNDPLAAGGRVVDGVVDPVEQAYEEGGALEAVGYGVVSGLTLFSPKSVTRLGDVAPDTPPRPQTTPDAPGPQRQDQPERRDCVSNSFTAQTPVLLADGSQRAIAHISVGDRVLATDPHSGHSATRTVQRVIVGQGPKTLVNIRADGHTITATDAHPFWVHSRRAWADAADLRQGDRLRTPNGHTTAIDAVRVLAPQSERVYNLTITAPHTYYAGHQPVLIHNAHCPDDGNDANDPAGDGDVARDRDRLLNRAQDPGLRDVIEQLYRPNARVGSGSAMDAYRFEQRTGQLLSPKGHGTKLYERRTQLQRKLRDLTPSDRRIARDLLTDIQNALSGR